MNRVKTVVFSLIIMSLALTALSVRTGAKETDTVHARPSENGKLSVRAANLVDESENKVILKGVSLHGVTWYPDFINADLFIQISKEWDANLIRIPVYPEEYINNRGLCLDLP